MKKVAIISLTWALFFITGTLPFAFRNWALDALRHPHHIEFWSWWVIFVGYLCLLLFLGYHSARKHGLILRPHLVGLTMPLILFASQRFFPESRDAAVGTLAYKLHCYVVTFPSAPVDPLDCRNRSRFDQSVWTEAAAQIRANPRASMVHHMIATQLQSLKNRNDVHALLGKPTLTDSNTYFAWTPRRIATPSDAWISAGSAYCSGLKPIDIYFLGFSGDKPLFIGVYFDAGVPRYSFCVWIWSF